MSWLTLLIYIVDTILILSLLFMERRNPSRSMLWIVVLLLLPVFGFILYLFFGQTFYEKHTFRATELSEDILAEAHAEGRITMKEDSERGACDLMLAHGLDSAGAFPYSNGNAVRLYTDGNEKFSDLIEDIRAAKRFVHLEYYIIRRDDLGDRIMDVLTEKAAEGVQVRLMSDGLGFNTDRRKAARLREAGGKVAVFHSTVSVLLSPKKNNRNHRKIAVIDGEVGYIGGFNIGDEYLGKGKFGNWRDSAVRITGPAVQALALRFNLDWRYAYGENLVIDPDSYAQAIGVRGDDSVQVVYGGPDMGDTNGISFQYQMMIERATRSIYLHTPYFSPNESCMSALRSAVMRGVDVRIIIPDKPDHPFVYWANRRCLHELMLDGAKVYEYRDGFVHSKTMVVDGRLCSVGSSNFDDRSMSLNFEANAMVYSEGLGREMEEAFMHDLERCTEYTLEMYDSRTLLQRFSTSASWLISTQL